MTRHHSASPGTDKTTALLEPPEHVPGYRDLVRIGHGGFSVVYRAVQESVDRAVAVKVLTVAGPDEDARRRFVREVRLAGRLSGHPHVVTVLDTGTTASGRPFLAMDLYDGGSMKEWLGRRGRLSPAQTAGLGAKIADALAAAHELGVLHRDVKPNNILVSRYGEPALADFGVSCLLDSSTSGSVLDIFSPQHAAPELMTRGVPSAASDVYALGSTLFELLTGRSPFGGNGQDVRATMFRTVSEPAPRAESPGLPGLADAIERAMAKDPADRFPDAAAFAQELRALIPDGTSAALAMADVSGLCWEDQIDMGHPAVVGPPPVSAPAPAPTPDPSGDLTDEMYVYSTSEHAPHPDDTMVRPDRVDEAEFSPGRSKRSDRGRPGRSGRDRSERPVGDRPAGGSRRGATAGSAVAAADGHGGGFRGGHGGGANAGAATTRASAAGAADRRGGGRGSGPGGGRTDDEPRSRKPLAIVAGVALVAGAAWAVIASQGSATPRDTATANPAPPATSGADSAGAPVPQPTPTTAPTTHPTSSSPSATHHTSSTPSHAAMSSSAAVTSAASAPAPPPSTAPASTTSSGPPLPGIYHRFRNAQSGACLAQPSGSGTAGAQNCASDRAQGWEYSVPLTGILGAVTGQFELVNGSTGQCLTGGSGGAVSVRPCTGSAGQIWAKTGGSGGATEFQNSGDGQCLKTVQGAVTEGACGSGDATGQWADDGTV